MTLSTVDASTSNRSDEQPDVFGDPFLRWRKVANTLSESSALPTGNPNPSPPSDTTTSTRIREVTAGTVYQQALANLRDRKAAAIRSAYEAANERRARPSRETSAGITGMSKWEGTVIDVDDEFFSARLTPLTDGTEVAADFPRELIADDDLEIGDVVYVTVRTVQGIGGPKRTSAVRLRRLGKWTQAEIADQKARAKSKLSRLESKFA